MGLTKSKTGAHTGEQRKDIRSVEGLLEQLVDPDMAKRRWAALDLADYADSAPYLFDALVDESETNVREALFASLGRIGGPAVVIELLDLLRAEDAELRNGAIEVLQTKPSEVADHIIELLNDPDSDVRIFAIDILQMLAHPDTPIWLESVLRDEQHVNVVAAALDRLAEVGTEDQLAPIKALKLRFAGEDYLQFAIDTAIRRIEDCQ